MNGMIVTAPATSGASELIMEIRLMLVFDAFPSWVSSTDVSIALLISCSLRVCSIVSASYTLVPVDIAKATTLVIIVVMMRSRLGSELKAEPMMTPNMTKVASNIVFTKYLRMDGRVSGESNATRTLLL